MSPNTNFDNQLIQAYVYNGQATGMAVIASATRMNSLTTYKPR